MASSAMQLLCILKGLLLVNLGSDTPICRHLASPTEIKFYFLLIYQVKTSTM